MRAIFDIFIFATMPRTALRCYYVDCLRRYATCLLMLAILLMLIERVSARCHMLMLMALL